jgi:hypothetical protein
MAPFSFYTDLPTKTFAIDQITNVDRVNEYRMSNKVYSPTAAPEATREFRMMKFNLYGSNFPQLATALSFPRRRESR